MDPPHTVWAVERCIRLFQTAGVQNMLVAAEQPSPELKAELRSRELPCKVTTGTGTPWPASAWATIRESERSIDALFVMPSCCHLVRPSTIAELRDVHEESTADAVRPSFVGRQGDPVIISAALCESIAQRSTYLDLQGLSTVLSSRTVEREVPDRFTVVDTYASLDCSERCEDPADYDIPTVEECKIVLIEMCRADWSLVAHSCKVAQVAYRLCRRLRNNGCELNEALVVAAALLHDVARGRADHASAGARILRELGFGRVADLVGAHMTNDVSGDSNVSEIDILRVADRMVQGDIVVTLDQRFRNKLWRLKHDAGAVEALTMKHAKARKLKHKVEAALGRPVETVVAEEHEQSYAISADSLFAQAW